MKSTTNQRKEHVGYNSVAVFIRLVVVASQIINVNRLLQRLWNSRHTISYRWRSTCV